MVIAIAGLAGVLIAKGSSGRISPALSLCWGLGWLAYGRLTGDLISVPAAVAAIVVIAAVAASTVIFRVNKSRAVDSAAV